MTEFRITLSKEDLQLIREFREHINDVESGDWNADESEYYREELSMLTDRIFEQINKQMKKKR